MNQIGTTTLVRGYFQREDSGSSAMISRIVKKPRKAVYSAIRELAKTGYLKRDENIAGLYHRAGDYNPTRPRRNADLQVKAWRAIRITRTFRMRDIVMYSGATSDYVKRYVSFLQSSGLVEKVGKKGREAIYKVRPDAPIEAPRMRHTVGPKPWREALDIAWELVRLLTAKNIEAALDAHERLGQIMKGVTA